MLRMELIQVLEFFSDIRTLWGFPTIPGKLFCPLSPTFLNIIEVFNRYIKVVSKIKADSRYFYQFVNFIYISM